MTTYPICDGMLEIDDLYQWLGGLQKYFFEQSTLKYIRGLWGTSMNADQKLETEKDM